MEIEIKTKIIQAITKTTVSFKFKVSFNANPSVPDPTVASKKNKILKYSNLDFNCSLFVSAILSFASLSFVQR